MARRKFLVADLLCGAGGSSTGAQRALNELGIDMELVCVNHWGVAIDTHRRNHPEARHYCQDIASVRPHIVVPEGYLDLLMASPSCTHHSVARGGKPTSDQQRSDPWHIVTWLTELRVKRIIIENVWEFISWGPVDPKTSRPIPTRKGEYFNAWIDTIRRLGFEPEWRKLNAADYGDATTRRRFILMARSDRRTVGWAVPTHHKREDNTLEFFPTVKPWRPAREIIDWSLKGKSIFDRKKPLASKTLARIHAGAVKFGWPEPYLVILRNHMTAQGIDLPLPTIAAGGRHIGLAQPVVVRSNMHGRKSPGARGVQDPLMTITTDGGIAVAEPIVLSNHNSGAPRSADEPLPTITTGGAAAEERQGCARPMLVEPFIATVAHGNDARERDPNSRRANSIDMPLGTVHGDGSAYAVVEPFVLSRQGGGAPRGMDEPTPTQVAKHSHVLVSAYYGANEGCTSGNEPLPTVTTKDRFGIVIPVTHAGGHDRAIDADETPLPTVTGANRGELAFIAAQFGEREGQSPRVHDIDAPAPAITATGHVNFIEGVVVPVTNGNGGATARDIETDPLPTMTTAKGGEFALATAVHADARQYDILFRMLEPHELAAAMGFSSEEYTYEFAGTKTEQVKQIGNAVSVAMMKACVMSLCADAARPGSRSVRPTTKYAEPATEPTSSPAVSAK